MNLKNWFKKFIPYILLPYSIYGIYNTVYYAKDLKDISLPNKEGMTRINKTLMQKEGEKQLTEQERELLFLKKESYNYHLILIERQKFLIGFWGILSVLSLFLSIYLFGKRELKSHGH